MLPQTLADGSDVCLVRPLFGKAHSAAGAAQAAEDTDVTMCHHGGTVALQLARGPLKGPFSSLIVGDKGTLLQGSLGVGRQFPAVPVSVP